MKIIISNFSNVPIYEQIKNQIKTEILSGTLPEGELLPSIRRLAKDIQVSVITTTRAYRELETEGLIAIIHGKGCYVMPQNLEIIREESLKEIEKYLLMAIGKAKIGGVSQTETKEMLEVLFLEDNNDV